jgi:uncharacterized protein (TIGR00369 family)
MSKVQESERTRTISWQDPIQGAQLGRTMSGMDYLKAMQEGTIPPPPIAVLMNMRIAEVSEGRVVFAAEPEEYHYNPIGTVHGGLAATLLDSALACAIHSTLPVGTAYTTLEIKVNYLRPMTRETGMVFCEGNVVHRGGRIATAEGRLTDEAGKLYAHATTTCLILRA